MIGRTSFVKRLLATSGRCGRLGFYRAAVGLLASIVVLATPVAAKSMANRRLERQHNC